MWPEVPALGFVGEAALRAAFAGDFRQLEDLLRGALKKLFKLSGDDDPWPMVQALFPDSVVVERDGKLWRYLYAVDGTAVTLGTPKEVVKAFVPATGDGVAAGAFMEAVGKGAARWRIRAIRAGLSLNGVFYPDAVLKEAAGLFEGVRVFVKSDGDHVAGNGKDVRQLIGRITDPKFVEGAAPDGGEIQATLELIEPEGPIAVKLRAAWERGMTALFGFSIDARGSVGQVIRGGRSVRAARKFIEVKSVDLIVEPAAGGEVINLIEAKKEAIMDRDEIIALIEARRPDLLKGKDRAALSDDDVAALLKEALAEPEPEPEPAPEPDVDDDPSEDGPASRAEVRMVEARARMRDLVNQSGLPGAAKARLIGEFTGRARFAEADVTKRIGEEKDYLANFTESGRVRGLGDDLRIEPGETPADKVLQMLEAFFDPAHKDHRHARSFKECYVTMTGDRRVTGLMRECDEARLAEALQSNTFDQVLGDSITRRMIADYRNRTILDSWRQIATIAGPTDFRTQERTRFGGYGDIPTVGEGQPYQALASPDDEKATYAVAKRGGTEEITIEMIKNDDSDVIRRIPTKLSRAAKRTLSKFVWDFIRNNPAIYDGLALFHATHGNLGSAALDATSFAAARLAMLKQTERDSGEQISVGPKSLAVPFDLEEGAKNLFRRDTNLDETFIQSLKPTIVPVFYWTDSNDWAAIADPDDVPTIEVGFLDGNEEPDLWVQDAPTSGSLFSHDKITYKLRHIYGGTVLDYRGMYKAVVA